MSFMFRRFEPSLYDSDEMCNTNFHLFSLQMAYTENAD